MIVEQIEPRPRRRLVDAEARATYCGEDTALVIVARGKPWAGGVLARVRLPLQASRTFAVRRAPVAVGVAAAAFRAYGDSASPALVAVSGSVRLEPGERLDGSVDLVAEERAGSSVRLVGRFRHVPIAAATRCSDGALVP